MPVEHLEIFVEELSMEAVLRVLLPRVVSNVSFSLYPYHGKSNLLARLPDRLRALAFQLPSTSRIVVLVDRDGENCRTLKRKLDDIARTAGLATKAAPRRGNYAVVNRIAIEELEAWYFGDWQAVMAAYPRVSANVPAKSKYRAPDSINGGTWEAFERVLQQAGYFKTGLRKIEVARAVAQHMDPSRNASPSFRSFRDALVSLA